MSDIKKVVLAYSGGLDTSVILKWLQDNYQCEVVTFTADIGQGEEVEPARAKAIKFGIKPENIYIDDLREEFVRDFVFPMFRANTVYEGEYLLGTSIARPLIAKRLIEIARETGADAISHGATGKGNDQVRFELGAYALKPDVKVIAPWREWDLLSREKLLELRGRRRHRRRHEAQERRRALLDGRQPAAHLVRRPAPGKPERRSRRIDVALDRVARKRRPTQAEYVDLEYERGDIVAINGKRMSPAEVLTELNRLGGKHGIGRLDLVENRYVGMKSRGCYETPGGTIMLKAPPRDRIDHAGPRSGAPEGRPDAALCVADLQRLLVGARARRAADADRPTQASAATRCDKRRELFACSGTHRVEPLGGKHGIGRLDLVENRYVGMKSRGCYETPGGTIMLQGASRESNRSRSTARCSRSRTI